MENNTETIEEAIEDFKQSDKESNLLTFSKVYRPFHYPWAVEITRKHEQGHWIEDEAELNDDVTDWKSNKLSDIEKFYITNILRLFTQSDVAVGQNYFDQFIPKFKNNEIRNMLGSFAARECFDSETEILTSSGWKNVKELNEHDDVAQFDIDQRSASFSKPTKVFKYKYNGTMHFYEGRTLNLCVTPEHEILLVNPHTRKLRKNKSANGVWGGNFLCPVSSKTELSKDISESEEALHRVLVMIQADGTIKSQCPWVQENRPNESRIYIQIKKERKIRRALKLLEKLNKFYNLNIKIYDKDSGIKNIAFSLPDFIDQSTIKSFDYIDLKNITSKECDIIIDELKYWDSTIQKDSSDGAFQYFNSNEDAINKIQAIAALHGEYRAISWVSRTAKEISGKIILDNKKETYTEKDAYVVSFVRTSESIYPKRKEIEYNGYVYCVEVPKHNIFCRRNGRVCISGNSIHQRAYALLNDTLGLPEEEYHAFLEYSQMANKIEFMMDSDVNTQTGLALALAKSVFNEGLSLFASFIMLLNFQRYGKMRGMCKITEWSMADENMHVEGLSKLFRTFVSEHPRIVNDEFKKKIYDMARMAVSLEDKFIDLVYKMGSPEGLCKEEVKKYIRYICDRRLIQLGLKGNYKVKDNPLEWISWVTGDRHANFFESRVTDYDVAGLSGDWGWE